MALLVLAACGSDPTATSAAPAATSTPSSPGTLIVYSGRSETLVDPIIKQFAQATGIDVKANYAGTAALAITLLEEGNNSPADVFFAQDPGGLGAVEEMLAPLPQAILDRVPSWARSADGNWVGISGRARTIVYNTETLTEADLPDSLAGLTDPKWKGRIGWAPTNGSFQTMVIGMRVLWGEEKTQHWIEGIQANNPTRYTNNTSLVAAAAAGEIDIGLVNHYYLHRFLAEEGDDFPARNYHPSGGGPGALVMVAGAGMLSTADNPSNAERFIEFLLSSEAQQYFANETFEYPLVENITVHHLLKPLSEINAPTVSMKDLADLEGTQALLQEIGVQ
ncbi:MAG: iron(III) transport system substrate-binding protein [Chloroflexi bacterium]|jgi:iron(III) transport system substrate-binding protein|nr:MAG: iron(III) transport system substrate-binding protein [Chloroflexota bacterium]